MTSERLTVEDFDGVPLGELELAHLAFTQRMDDVARRYGERSYVLPLSRCPGCVRLGAAYHRHHDPSPTPGDPR